MSSSRAAEFLRRAGDPRRASHLELFFDLAFIFALARMSRYLLVNLSPLGAWRAAILLAGLWGVWVTTAWSANWFDTGNRTTRQYLVGVMLGGLVMAAAVPKAFDGHALVFAGALLAVHLGRGLGFGIVLRGHPLQWRSLRIVIAFLFTGALWIPGALVPSARIWLWSVAVILDYVFTRTRWPVPVIGRSSWAELRIVGEHLSERYQQVFIVAVGDMILTIGTAFSDGPFNLVRSVAFGASFASATLLAVVYFIPREGRLGEAIDAAREPGRMAMNAAFLHLGLIGGVLAVGVGDEIAITGAGGPPQPRIVAVTIAGVIIYLIGRNTTAFLIDRRVPWPGLIAMVVLLAVVPALLRLPPAGSAVAVDIVFGAIVVDDSLHRWRTGRTP